LTIRDDVARCCTKIYR